MHDGTMSTHANLPAEMLHKNGAPVFSLVGKMYALGHKEGYRQFWATHHKPPISEYRDNLLERRNRLSNKVPAGLRAAIAAGKKILVRINPPYAEAANFGDGPGFYLTPENLRQPNRRSQ